MKKTLVLVLLMSVLLLTGCMQPQNQPDQSENTYQVGEQILLWTGEYSKEKHVEIINMYREQCSNIVFADEKDAQEVSFDTDFDVKACRVTRLSPTSEEDINVELDRLYDSIVFTEINGERITINTTWVEAVDNYPVWSYLVRVTDVADNTYYYYFRTDYSALFAQ